MQAIRIAIYLKHKRKPLEIDFLDKTQYLNFLNRLKDSDKFVNAKPLLINKDDIVYIEEMMYI